MSLRIVRTAGGQLVGGEVRGALSVALRSCGRAVLLVPTFAQALAAQRALADDAGLSLALSVTTPDAWADERWEVWGDGRRVVSEGERLVLMRLALDDAPLPLARTGGALDALCLLARSSLAWIAGPASARGPAVGESLSGGERHALTVLSRYGELLADRGLVERCEAMALLPQLVPSFAPVYAAGFSGMPQATRELLLGVADQADMTLFVPADARAAGLSVEGLARRLAREAAKRRIAVRGVEAGEGCAPAAAPELLGLRGRIFRDATTYEPLRASGAVALLEPAGPLAEWELVAREVVRLSRAGARAVAVVCADVAVAWDALAPKLAARGVRVSADVRRPASAVPQLQAFLSFAQAVARLSALDATWPGPACGPEGAVPQLGSMAWWPPRALTDFLLSEVSGVPPRLAWSLDAKWRGNRMLSPRVVLDQLQRESLTSRAVARSTVALLRGRVGTAALQLARGLASSGGDHAEALAALVRVQDAARALSTLGVGPQGAAGVRVALPLERLVSLVTELCDRAMVSSSVALGPPEAPCAVRVLARRDASALDHEGVDALVACGLTAEEWPLSPRDDAVAALLGHLGLDLPEDPLDAARTAFYAMVCAPRSVLLLERVSHNASAEQTYPAVMLSEALACYVAAPAAVTLGERGASGLLTAQGSEPPVLASLPNAEAGVIGDGLRDMVVVPREGQDALPGGVPSLSASQIESYLECPYKWFTLRRLGLGTQDADFSPLQAGSFAHRVLEVSRRMLAQRAAQDAGLVAPGEPLDLEGSAIPLIRGARITDDNVDLARGLVETEFDYHLMHQRQRATTLAAQSLVPHTATQEYLLGLLRQDLLSVLDFERTRLVGFEPRYFELRFGGTSAKARHVTYAGVDFVGSIDRVDVDAQGRAVVIDYKHRQAAGFAGEYDAFPAGAPLDAAALVVPRRVQSLIYAQVIRRMFPHLKVVGAIYLSTQGGRRRTHDIAGALDASVVERVMGSYPGGARASRLVAGGRDTISFEDLLDECERRIGERVRHLVAGDIQADPVDDKACSWCPVANCERRRS